MMDSIRNTMQMHEGIFKHQVRELHWLYSVQKMLTDELRKEIQQNRLWACSDIKQHHLTQANRGNNFHLDGSGSCSGDTVKPVRGFQIHLERPASEDEAEPMHSSLTHSRINHLIQGSDEDTEVELTLSIGGSSRKKMASYSKPYSQIRKEIRQLDSPASFKPDKKRSNRHFRDFLGLGST